VTPLSLGVETLGGVMTKLLLEIPQFQLKNLKCSQQQLIIRQMLKFTFYKVKELVAGNKSLGNFRLDGIPNADRGVPQIEVTFDVDGILSVKARERETGVEQSVTIQGASN
jgi:molecular chaperone DnaK